ncbi:MAG: response regulator [Spirochaetales bacterium]|nr:response regulator [Spirochaetales bacterium]
MDKIKILAVDDEPGVLNVIKNVCRNYEIITETSALRAVERIRNEKFDIFIIDYQMPVIDGIELLEEIQEKNADSYYVSIFSTAYGTIHLFKDELCNGLFSYFIEKPFETDILREIMKKSIIKLGIMKSHHLQKIHNN